MTWQERYNQALMTTFGTPQRLLVAGQGCYLTDEDGRRYLDLLAGIATVGLGHSHPAIASALAEQAQVLGHVSNFFATPPQIELAERLGGYLTGPATNDQAPKVRVFFTNSGTEANEAGLKLTRLTGRTKVVAAEGSFHGRSFGALSLTWSAKYRQPFEPLPGEVVFVPYGDSAALAAAVDDATAAVILEPIQGENGVIVPPDGYLTAARQITARHGALLWLDEIQSGMGRTGAWFAHSAEAAAAPGCRWYPDIVTVAKALGNGFPIGACLALGEAAELFTPGSHGTTFGGNPLAASVGLATTAAIAGLLPQVVTTGGWLRDQLAGLPGVAEVRGRGLFIGVRLADPIAPQFQAAALNAGIIVNAPRPDTIRLVPPLIITKAELEQLIRAWPGLIDQAAA